MEPVGGVGGCEQLLAVLLRNMIPPSMVPVILQGSPRIRSRVDSELFCVRACSFLGVLLLRPVMYMIYEYNPRYCSLNLPGSHGTRTRPSWHTNPSEFFFTMPFWRFTPSSFSDVMRLKKFLVRVLGNNLSGQTRLDVSRWVVLSLKACPDSLCRTSRRCRCNKKNNGGFTTDRIFRRSRLCDKKKKKTEPISLSRCPIYRARSLHVPPTHHTVTPTPSTHLPHHPAASNFCGTLSHQHPTSSASTTACSANPSNA